MDWFSSQLPAGFLAEAQKKAQEAAEKAREFAAQASVQAKAIAEQATTQAKVCRSIKLPCDNLIPTDTFPAMYRFWQTVLLKKQVSCKRD